MNSIDKPLRNHWTYVGKEIINTLYQSLLILILIISKFKLYMIPLMLVLIVISILKWRNDVVFITENEMLIHKSGIINKKKVEIPLAKISTVDVEETLLNKILGTYKLKIDNGVPGTAHSEVQLLLNKRVAQIFKQRLFKSSTNLQSIVERETFSKDALTKIKASKSDLIIYGLTQRKIGWVLGGVFIFYDRIRSVFDSHMGNDFVNKYVSKYVYKAIDIQTNIFTNKSVMFFVVFIGLSIAMVYVLISFIAVILTLIKYNDFTVSKGEKKIEITYGLFTKKAYSLPIKKIHGLKLNQNIMQQLLGIYTVESIVIGYGDNEKNAMIYPVADKRLLEVFLIDFFPDLKSHGEINIPHRSTFKRFIFIRMTIAFIIVSLPLYFIKAIPVIWRGFLIVIMVLWQLFLGYRDYKNTSLAIDDKAIILSRGSFKKVTHMVKKDTVEALTKKQSIFQRPKKICNIGLHIGTNTLGEVLIAKHLEEELFEAVYSSLPR